MKSFTISKNGQPQTSENVDNTEKYRTTEDRYKYKLYDKYNPFTPSEIQPVNSVKKTVENEYKSDCYVGLFLLFEGEIYNITQLILSEGKKNVEDKVITVFGVNIKVRTEKKETGDGESYCLVFENSSSSVRVFSVMCLILPAYDSSLINISSVFFDKMENGVKLRMSDAQDDNWICVNLSETADMSCFSVKRFFEGKFDGCSEAGEYCCAVGRKVNLAVGGKIKFSFSVFVKSDNSESF